MDTRVDCSEVKGKKNPHKVRSLLSGPENKDVSGGLLGIGKLITGFLTIGKLG